MRGSKTQALLMRFALPFLSLITTARCQQRLSCALLLRKPPSWCVHRAARQPPSQSQKYLELPCGANNSPPFT